MRLPQLPFDEFSATGNCFAFVQAPLLLNVTLENLRTLAHSLCNTFQLDGLVVWQHLNNESRFLILNSDGSLAGTCGNALRAFAYLLLKRGEWNGALPQKIFRYFNSAWAAELRDEEFFANNETGAFACLHRCTTIDANNAQCEVLFEPPTQITTIAHSRALMETLCSQFKLTQRSNKSAFVTLANPHWFFFDDAFRDFRNEDFVNLGKYLQQQGRSENSLPVSNIGMCWHDNSEPLSRFHLTVFERGAGLTQCCGSGAVAAFEALHHLERAPHGDLPLTFQMPGGMVSVSKNENGDCLSGSVEFRGEKAFSPRL